ncbi:hypothetical protein ACOME3_005104 [Neoechinorhynchus agilis]
MQPQALSELDIFSNGWECRNCTNLFEKILTLEDRLITALYRFTEECHTLIYLEPRPTIDNKKRRKVSMRQDAKLCVDTLKSMRFKIKEFHETLLYFRRKRKLVWLTSDPLCEYRNRLQNISSIFETHKDYLLKGMSEAERVKDVLKESTQAKSFSISKENEMGIEQMSRVLTLLEGIQYFINNFITIHKQLIKGVGSNRCTILSYKMEDLLKMLSKLIEVTLFNQ